LTATLMPEHDSEVVEAGKISEACDLVIVIGGDGSMLNAARVLTGRDVAVLGINRGRLGFLTDILPDEIETKISQVLAGDYTEESRFLLDVVATRAGKSESLGCALNDVVLHPGKAAQMIEFELFVDDHFVYSQQSDGLIVATPTGSTAYALSAGGPIMHPQLDAFVLVPMHPHSLNTRPITISADSIVRIIIAQKHSILPQVSCDGRMQYTAMPGDEIIMRKKTERLRLIHPGDHNFYKACRSKLGWAHRLARSS